MKITRLRLTVILVGGLSSWAPAQRGGVHHSGVPGRAAVDARQQMKIRASDEQGAQLRTCVSVSERLRMLATELTQPGRPSELDRKRQFGIETGKDSSDGSSSAGTRG